MKEKYTFDEIQEKYGLGNRPLTTERMIKYAADCGLQIQPYQNKKTRPQLFEIINDDIMLYYWITCPLLPTYEVCPQGLIRNKETKRLWDSEHNGYIYVTDYKTKQQYAGHRLILTTFNPIANSKDFLVDHINGKKTDNRVENLRWVSNKNNNLYKVENWDKISKVLYELLDLVGYDGVITVLQDAISKNKKI